LDIQAVALTAQSDNETGEKSCDEVFNKISGDLLDSHGGFRHGGLLSRDNDRDTGPSSEL
jgi:hypothetical protein